MLKDPKPMELQKLTWQAFWLTNAQHVDKRDTKYSLPIWCLQQ